MTWKFYSATEFSSRAQQWRDLNCGDHASPALDPEFVLPLLTHFADGREILAVYEKAGTPRAMTLLQQTRGGVWQTFQPSQAPLGLWVSAPAFPITELLRELLPSLSALALMAAVSRLDPALTPRPADDSLINTVDYINTARISIAGDFETYWTARGKNLRHNLKRQRNGLEKRGVMPRLVVLTNAQEMEAAVSAYGNLESVGWKGSEGSAVHCDNAQGRFYIDMLRNFCLRGDGCVFQYWYDDRLVAVDLCIRGNGVFIILKTTYDESEKTSSPAMLMRYEAFRAIFAQPDVRTLEFYGQVMDWHTKWSNDIRTMYHLNVYRWPVLARLHRTWQRSRTRRGASTTTVSPPQDEAAAAS